MVLVLVVWLFGLFFAGVVIGVSALFEKDLEVFIEIGIPVAIAWTIIWWGLVFFAAMAVMIYS